MSKGGRFGKGAGELGEEPQLLAQALSERPFRLQYPSGEMPPRSLSHRGDPGHAERAAGTGRTIDGTFRPWPVAQRERVQAPPPPPQPNLIGAEGAKAGAGGRYFACGLFQV